MFDEEEGNASFVCYSPDGDLVQGYWQDAAPFPMVVRQSFTKGSTWTAPLTVDSPHSGKGGALWTAPFTMGARAVTPNVGVVMSWETNSQNQADIYFTPLTTSVVTTTVTVGQATETDTAFTLTRSAGVVVQCVGDWSGVRAPQAPSITLHH
jgi:hypothetical protein